VISKKKNFIDFLDDLGLFIGENPYEKKNSVALPSGTISRLLK
jgi:hypothetical protein